MNVLEKILEEIEERVNYRKRLVRYEKKNGTITDIARNRGALEELVIVEKIIRSHMDDGKNTNVPSNWIPCSERLPEEGIYVMCCFDDGSVDVLWQKWQEDETLLFYADFDNQIRKVIAWQPLPASYKGEEASE